MKYINISKLEQEAKNLNWDSIRQKHLNKLACKSPAERKEYITNNRDWNLLQKIMLKLSNNKCWYSEGPIGNNDFEVDHFRPKNKAKQKIDYTDPKSKSIVLKENGYWWKAYDCDNYRLSGGLANKLRRDRLGDCDEVKGKGDYFPLDLNGVGQVAPDEGKTNCEIPILLDPCVEEDVSLLTFDQNGEAISAGDNEYEHNRVLQSIFYYHLDLEQLNKKRLMAWKDCEREILEAKMIIDEAPDERARRIVMKSCLSKIKDYVKNPDREYTSVMKSCIKIYAELSGFIWLKRFVLNNLI